MRSGSSSSTFSSAGSCAPRACCQACGSTVHGCPRRTTSVLQRRATSVLQKMQKHYSFGRATTRKPAEGLRLYVKKRKNTTVLAPRQRRNPAEGVTFVCQKKQKHDGFGTAPTPKPADGFSTATRRLPAEGCPRKSRNVKKRRF